METGNGNVSDTIATKKGLSQELNNKSVQLHMVSTTAQQYDIARQPTLKIMFNR